MLLDSSDILRRALMAAAIASPGTASIDGEHICKFFRIPSVVDLSEKGCSRAQGRVAFGYRSMFARMVFTLVEMHTHRFVKRAAPSEVAVKACKDYRCVVRIKTRRTSSEKSPEAVEILCGIGRAHVSAPFPSP
jgi:hypothetical protein